MNMNRGKTLKGCYLHYRDISDANPNPTGMDQKVAGQIESFRRAGMQCDFILCRQPENLLGKSLSSIPFLSDRIEWPDAAQLAGYDYVYIRRPRFASKNLIRMLTIAKQINDKLRVIYEIPTYPYDHEMTSLIMQPARMKDHYWRQRLRNVIDRIAYIGNEDVDRVFGCKAIRIKNGIDLDRYRKRSPRKDDRNSINMICVAQFQPWHGVDRLIEGIAKYYSTANPVDITVHLVGDGPEIPNLTKMVNRYHLDDSFIFHGRKKPQDFLPLFDECDIAVECLANHRKGITVSSSLKSREYLAIGIPFVYAGAIDVFLDKPIDFCFQAPSDESAIDIRGVINHIDRLKRRESGQDLIDRIRSYAENNISIDSTMKPVIEYIKEECNRE